MNEWLERIEHSIKPSMVQNWRNYAAYYVIPYIGQRDVQAIDGAVCDALYAKLLAEGASRQGPSHPGPAMRYTAAVFRQLAMSCRAAPTDGTP